MQKLITLLLPLLAWLQSFFVGEAPKSKKSTMDAADVTAVLRSALIGAVAVFLTQLDSADWGLVDPLIGALVVGALEWLGAYKRDNTEGEEILTAVSQLSVDPLAREEIESMLGADAVASEVRPLPMTPARQESDGSYTAESQS